MKWIQKFRVKAHATLKQAIFPPIFAVPPNQFDARQMNVPMHRSRGSVRVLQPAQRRRGLTTPAVAIAMLVVMMGLALIIDRIWLETAQLELRTTAEAAALAAAGELATDTLLQPSTSVDVRMSNARQVATWIAEQNYVAGSAVRLNTEPEGDIRIGILVQDSMGTRFEESTTDPTTVVVTTLRTRANNNPVGLFVSGATGLPYGDVAARAEASVNNDVIGLRAVDGMPIPALPIAILERDPTKQRSDTWEASIEGNQGRDQYMFDTETNQVVEGQDGIPELVLKSLVTGGEPSDCNVQLLDLGTGMLDVEVTRQFKSGVTFKDIQDLDSTYDGELWIGQGAALQLSGSPKFDGAHSTEYQKLIGHRRICFLYSKVAPQHEPPLVTATCDRIVAIRIMAITANNDGSSSVTIQPTVMTTRTAMLASENTNTMTPRTSDTLDGQLETNLSDSLSNSAANSTSNTNSSTTTVTNVIPNRYVYKLRLTY